MRLAPLLAALPDEELERLAVEHVRTDEKLPRPQLCNFLEGALRSYRFVHDFVTNRQPPTFAMLTLLLDAPRHELPREGFRELVLAETRRIAELIDGGELLAREDQLRLYRRALFEARRNDLDLNSSEAALLALLRRETGIAQVEHFLIEHHQDLREFWDKDDSFTHEKNALRSAGLIFVHNETLVVPEEVVPAIWQTLGIDMPTDSARRLFAYLSSGELATGLETAGSRTSGSKEARLERLLVQRVQPRAVLRTVPLSTLKEICRTTEASVSGNKDELVERIIEHFAQRKDQREEEPVPPPTLEPRRLDGDRFATMFSSLLHQELTDILRRFPQLKQTGTKEARIRTLWEAHLSERTLLGELMNRDLENILHRLGLKLGGSKDDRIERIVGHFAASALADGGSQPAQVAKTRLADQGVPGDPDVLARQDLFRQKASSPQTLLQPWLEQMVEGQGLIRCYATEDANPTKQLKNKLSQAAAARGGLLVLLLADEDSFLKAREALLERWMTNVEWPKSIASVALAYPLAAPRIEAIIERANSPWASRLRDRLFPSAEIRHVSSDEGASVQRCSRCSSEVPPAARFCPNCGASIA
jgi:hypothetical protein